jgi:hypothetical protein
MAQILPCARPPEDDDMAMPELGGSPNNSLERTQPQRGFMYDVAVLRGSARGRWAAPVATSSVGERRTLRCFAYSPG